MLSLLEWYFTRAPKAQFYFIIHVLTFFEDFIGLRVNLRFLFLPIFNDNSLFGRVMSLIIRITIIVCGFVALTVLSVALLILPVGWFISLILWVKEPFILSIPVLGIIYYFLYSRREPRKLHPHKYQTHELENFAVAEARAFLFPPYNHSYIEELCSTASATHLLQRLTIPVAALREVLLNNTTSESQFDQILAELIRDLKPRFIRPVHIIAVHLLANEAITLQFLQSYKTDLSQLKKYLLWEEYEYLTYHPPLLWDEDYKVNTSGGTNVTWQGTVTPLLNQFSRDLTAHVTSHPIRVIRQYLIDEIEQGLQKNMSASVLLVGEIGVGKDKLAEIIAQEINKGHIKGFLWSKRIVQLDIGSLYAGTTEKGAFEKRVQDIIKEINRSGNIVLYLNDFKSALAITTSGTISLLSLLQEPLANNKLHIIGAVTPKQLTEIENENPSFIQEFTIVHITEPNQAETTNILFNEGLYYEERKKIFIPYPIIDRIYQYANEYIQTDHFPQKGIRLLEDTLTYAGNQRLNTQWNTKYGARSPVLEEHINTVIAQKFHIPVGDTQSDEAQKLLNLEELFAKKVVGQTDAVKAVAEVLRRNRLGLRNKNKPVGSFLFVGPTGVGKTKMAKVLAEEYFGNINQMIRLDMSEFQSSESIERLIGSPALGSNYLTLTQLLRNQPFSLVLLDELEKAHPKILDLFLQVLDDGRLTDSQGETIHCNEAIFIATSNAGTQKITSMFQQDSSPDVYQTINKEIYHILSDQFRIEFLNRFDDIIIFKPLTPTSLRKIVQLELEQITQSLYEDKKIQIHFSDETIKQVINAGYNPELGARPLERAIQEIIESKLATLLLQGKVHPGEEVTL